MALSVEEKLKRLMDKYIKKFKKAFKVDYSIGSAVTIQNAKISGKKTSMSPLNISKKDMEANVNIIETLIKDVNSEVAKKIDLAVNKNITERGSGKDLAQDLKDLFNKDVPGHFNYKNRFENIAETEANRVLNLGSYNTAKRVGATGKYINNVMDSKTGEDSKVSEKKYGSPDKAIPLDEPFKYTYKGQVREFMLPPDRPRDRASVLFTFE